MTPCHADEPSHTGNKTDTCWWPGHCPHQAITTYHSLRETWYVNSLAPQSCNLILVIFKPISRRDIFSISCETALRWMQQHLTDDESTLVQVMAWCRQATSHYLSQCWPRSLHHTVPLGLNELIKLVCLFPSSLLTQKLNQLPEGNKPLSEPKLTKSCGVTRPEWVNYWIECDNLTGFWHG